jgi:hypothetical protein
MSTEQTWRRVVSRIVMASRALVAKLHRQHAHEPPPAMIGTPPSARRVPAVPTDPAEHAADFAARYAEPMDYLIEQRMTELGIPDQQIGACAYGVPHSAFWPHETTGGGNVPGPRFTVDSGVFNPELMANRREAGSLWARSRLRDRIDAIIAHEVAESQTGDHWTAELIAPETPLPISERARHILRAIKEGTPG